jgi:hypothetical protein
MLCLKSVHGVRTWVHVQVCTLSTPRRRVHTVHTQPLEVSSRLVSLHAPGLRSNDPPHLPRDHVSTDSLPPSHADSDFQDQLRRIESGFVQNSHRARCVHTVHNKCSKSESQHRNRAEFRASLLHALFASALKFTTHGKHRDSQHS